MNKKLFISVPMNGYTEDEIDKMINYLKDTAEAYFGEFFDILETHRFVRVPKNAKNDRIYMLGDSIKQYLSKADYYIGIKDRDCVDYLISGCAVENLVWKIYYPNEGNALFCDYSIMCKNLKIKKRMEGTEEFNRVMNILDNTTDDNLLDYAGIIYENGLNDGIKAGMLGSLIIGVSSAIIIMMAFKHLKKYFKKEVTK